MSDGMIIKVDVAEGGVKQKVQDIEQTFAKLEARGPSVSAALTKGLADGSAAAERLKTATGAVVNPFDSLTAAIKREQDVLERIHGPAREYAQDLQALDALLEKNTISTSEYAEQVTRLNQAIKDKHETESEGASPVEGLRGGSEALTGLMAGGAAAGVIELGKHVGELIESGQRLQDIEIGMANAAIRFTDALHDSNDVIEEQSKLGEELHSTYGPTVELYARVKEGSDELNLSHKEQIELTKTLGEEVQLAGRPLGDASGLMARFAFAMQSGHIETRQLSQIMREVPGIMDIWKEAFGKNVGAILSDVKAGKISVDDLVRALIEHGNVADKNFSKHRATNEVLKEQWKETVALKGVYGEFAEGVDKAVNGEHTFGDALRAASGAIDEQADKLKQTSRDALGNVGTMANQLHEQFRILETDLGDVARAVGVVGDTWDQQLGKTASAFKVGLDSAAELGKAKQDAAALDEAEALSGGKVLDYYEKRKALAEKIGGDETKLFYEITGPLHTYNQRIGELSDLLARGAIDASKFETALLKLDATIGKKAEVNMTDSFVARHGGQPSFLDVAGGDGSTSAPTADPKAQRALELYNSTRTAAEKYADELQELNKLSAEGYINDQAKVRILSDLEKKYGDAAERAKQLKIETEQYFKELDANAKTAEKVLEPIGKTLLDAAKSGTIEWKKWGESLIDMLAEVAEKALVAKAALALANAFTPTPSLAQASGGWDINAIAQMAGLGGAATGGYFEIPHAANGFAGVVPQRSGQDTHLAMFHVRQGEDVTIRTPEQRAAAANGQGGQMPAMPVTHQAIFQGIDDRAIHAAMDTPGGTQAVFKIVRDNAGAFRALLR